MKKRVKKEKLLGIGGWLILLTIILIIKACAYSFVAIAELFYIILVNHGIGYILAFLTIAVFAFFQIYSLILEFKEKKGFPKWVIIFIFIEILVTLLWYITEKMNYTLIGNAIFITILIWYLSRSKRVKNTFVK